MVRKKSVVHKKSSKKNKNSEKTLDKFYTAEQKHRAEIERQEMEIFEHLKQHTKKILNK